MTKIIQQTVTFKGVSPKELFETYLDSKKHAAAIGAPASINRRAGGKFTAFGEGHLVGTILHLVSNQMIVQTWRGRTEWKKSEPDSILVLTFEKIAGGTKLSLVQSGVPAKSLKKFNQGWHQYYWKPWKRYFEEQVKKNN